MCCHQAPPTAASRAAVRTQAKSKCITESIVSQNLLGLKSESRLEEFFYSLRSRGLLAVCVQETWRPGLETLKNGGCLLFTAGLKKADMKSNRGEQGVGIALSEKGVPAWKEAGSVLHNDFGGRVIEVRLQPREEKGRPVVLFLVSVYSPVGNSHPERWEEFLIQLDACIARKVKGDVLVIGIDSNSSVGTMGRDDQQSMTAVGPHGCAHLNLAGERFRTYLEVSGLTAATTYFKKKAYGTWIHPARKSLIKLTIFSQRRVISVDSQMLVA